MLDFPESNCERGEEWNEAASGTTLRERAAFDRFLRVIEVREQQHEADKTLASFLCVIQTGLGSRETVNTCEILFVADWEAGYCSSCHQALPVALPGLLYLPLVGSLTIGVV